ncbi:MAG: MFS transporter [Bacteroidota bacterium]
MSEPAAVAPAPSPLRRILTMASLVLAGEAIFFLPFVIVRIFRPTLLEVFGITNFELGTATSAYGVVAMVAYFIGGPLADRFSTKVLLPFALIATGLGGLFMATIPSIEMLTLLYAYWGLTTILLFWAALMRATREWGGSKEPGKAFGLLDAGRGALGATIGSVGVLLFALAVEGEVAEASLEARTAAFKQVLLMVSGIVVGVGILIYFVLPNTSAADSISPKKDSQSLSQVLAGILRVIKMPTVWLQAVIILCAYVGYKGTDDLSLYANEVIGLDEVDAANMGNLSLWIRPIAAILAGILADRVSTSRMTIISFGLMLLGSLSLASGLIDANGYILFVFTIVGAGLGIYALRGLYFAIMEEGNVPLAVTGSAVGLVSVLGYTPDIFFGPLMGYLLDENPGVIGHQYVFMVVGVFALVGLLATITFRIVNRKHHTPAHFPD